MRNILILTLFLVAQPGFASGQTHRLKVGEGVVLNVNDYGYHRFLPYSFYDQAVSSIQHLYSGHVFLAKRRDGRLGKIQYSIICYKQAVNQSRIYITGVAVLGNNAWSFETDVPESSYGDKLLVVLEAIGKLPSYKALRPTAKDR